MPGCLAIPTLGLPHHGLSPLSVRGGMPHAHAHVRVPPTSTCSRHAGHRGRAVGLTCSAQLSRLGQPGQTSLGQHQHRHQHQQHQQQQQQQQQLYAKQQQQELGPITLLASTGQPIQQGSPTSPPSTPTSTTTTTTTTPTSSSNGNGNTSDTHQENGSSKDASSTSNSNSSSTPLQSSNSAEAAKQPSNKGGPDPPEDPDNNKSSTPLLLKYFLLLLTEYGGVYGSAAVAIAFFTHIDPFGSFHWDADDITLALKLFLPVLITDALILLPDYTLEPEQAAQQTAKLFLSKEVVEKLKEAASSASDKAKDLVSGTSGSTTSAGGAAVTASSSSSAAVEGEDGPEGFTGSGPSAGERMRAAMEMLQGYYVRNNAGLALSPVMEFLVILVACLADEMLYRAVMLTLAALWLRDRAFEGGFDDTFLWGDTEVITGDAAKWAVVGLGAGLGVAAFALRAAREVMATQKNLMSWQPKTPEEEAAKKRAEALRRLQPQTPGGGAQGKGQKQKEGSLLSQLSPETVEQLKSQLASNMGTQAMLVWTVEGARDVLQVAASGAAFVMTGNLAAPYAGSVLVQCLFSWYQRRATGRLVERRAAMWERMAERRKKRRQQQQQAAAAAAAAAAAKAPPTEGAAEASADASAEATSAAPIQDVSTSTSTVMESSHSGHSAVADASADPSVTGVVYDDLDQAFTESDPVTADETTDAQATRADSDAATVLFSQKTTSSEKEGVEK